MKHSTGNPTKSEAKRMDTIKDASECVCCKKRKLLSSYVEIHHLLSGNKRMGHMFTVGLCPWHHRGVPMYGYTRRQMQEIYGDSLAHGSKIFRAQFGSDMDLLEMQNEVLDESLCKAVELSLVGAVGLTGNHPA